MIKKSGFAVAFVFLMLSSISAQDTLLSAVRERFDNFDYRNVIDIADSLLLLEVNFSKDDKAELLRMKAVSQYSLSDTKGAEESFKEILNLSSGFILDSLNNSPKIVAFFNEIKTRFKPETPVDKTSNMNNEAELKPKTSSLYLSEYNNRLKGSLVRSIMLPGWGHFYSGDDTKGWILGTMSAASLASFIYFIADSRTKEKTYLNERNPLLIPDKYDKYNLSNKMKYVSLAAYAAVWLYSQADLLFFSDALFKTQIDIQPEQINKGTVSEKLNFSISIPLP